MPCRVLAHQVLTAMRLRSSSGRTVQALLAAVLLAAAQLPAWAQLRTIPQNGKRSTLSGYENPFVFLGGEQRRLAPGAVIFDTNNRMILPGYLPGGTADVVYTTDQTGQVMRIYLLTPQEIQRLNETRR
jgi:hypothetical protein